MEERLQKIISAAGICSRRAAEELITAGKVTVNGIPAQMGQRADSERDDIRVEGKRVGGAKKHVYLLLNKPRGYVTTLSDEMGRKTVAELVKGCRERVYPVGRLDMYSEGLLLMTNDGELMQRLIHPSFEVNKTYLVTVAGETEGAENRLGALREIDGEKISPAQVSVEEKSKDGLVLRMVIHEGKNRQIRRMCACVGLKVRRLQRIAEHDLTLDGIPLGKWRYLTPQETAGLRALCEAGQESE